MSDRGCGAIVRDRRIFVACLAAFALSYTACGLGDRAALEDVITAAPKRVTGRLVTGSVTVESRFVDGPTPGAGGVGGFVAPAGAEDFKIPEGGYAFGSDTVAFAMDAGPSRATLTRAGADRPLIVIDDLVFFGRRSAVAVDEARPWIRLDLSDVTPDAGELDLFGRATDAIAALHPAIVTDLAGGALTGSIKRRGRARVNGVDTTHYAVNISIDKALGQKGRNRYPEDRRETVLDLIRFLGVDGNLHKAEVWLDDDNRLRRFSVSLSQKPATRVEFALVVTVDYLSYGGRYVQALPTPQEVLGVDNVARFISTVAEPLPSTPGEAETDASR